jgi:hypothetical protein
MSFRPHGRAEISATWPRARAVCDFCGFIYNLDQLKWEKDWRGTKLQNLRFLVCDSCLDVPQQNGQRTIILPADPVPVMYARPEQYVPDSNPLSAIGANPSPSRWQFSGQIGNMVNAGGVPAAFDGNVNKPSFMSAMISTPNSSYNNYVGINWSGYPATTLPASLDSPVLTHTVESFTITAPNNSTFGSTAYVVQGSQVNSGFGSWTTIASGNPVGTVGESITGTGIGPRFQFHRVAFYGGASGIAVAQVTFNVSDGSSNT